VGLGAKTTRLDGHEVLAWFNKFTGVITEMPFHRYLNAFCTTRPR